MPARRATSMARSTRFSGEMRPRKARYWPASIAAASSSSGGMPWWIVATQLALGSGARWSFEIETTGISLNSA